MVDIPPPLLLLTSRLLSSSPCSEVLSLANFWISRGFRCQPFSPSVRAFVLWRIGFSMPTACRLASTFANSCSRTFTMVEMLKEKSIARSEHKKSTHWTTGDAAYKMSPGMAIADTFLSLLLPGVGSVYQWHQCRGVATIVFSF